MFGLSPAIVAVKEALALVLNWLPCGLSCGLCQNASSVNDNPSGLDVIVPVRLAVVEVTVPTDSDRVGSLLRGIIDS